jgi:tripartite-type tricarboxylate transporter receptor subunit TctC
VAALLWTPAHVFAQAYPTRTVEIIVAYPPGGSGDLMARVIAERMASSWGQQVIVLNKPGAAGMIAAEASAKSRPDGHTIFLGYTSEMAVNQSLYAKMTYDPLRDFSPVAMSGVLPLLLVANPSLAARTVEEIIALARARPGELTFASSGVGAPASLGMELLMSSAKVKLLNVPYKGGGEIMAAVLGGQVNLFFSSIPPALPNVESGKLRAVAVSTGSRVPSLPNVPTIAESGVPGFDVSGWFAFFVPAGTPRPVIDRIADAVNATVKDPQIAKQFASQGIVVSVMTPEQLGSFVQQEAKKYARIIKEAGVKIE